MSDYKLFVGTACPHCRKVENFLEENDIKIDIVNINEDRDAMMELIQKGGKRQVPCLFHDGKYLYESNDIIDFLGK
ncbi:MAG: glutathione S-transferase N-terminal domain-containing protein [Anaerococcus hydrogenalis]|uniref:glutaredoxin family protein n=1 Tax=Anaerococcus TaxID=165779 RepID=UPI0003122F73|nr:MULTISPECIES: glutathione S-transferase N-terminal domain-containing protein [Anaerococcus]MDU2202444.1 glutathione S-transferase N-terminal domain-containing protein [Anaerococcus hydrogenalis]MDU2583419.1 glutathione S-transferase N-terminal domain-containing protein [Anaerococcus hydrogenalis]MDU3199428.1 glutathione S-transferase N-terminal domain-containing protein [Anaerococcus hydrogenalis]MDU3688581.1 glutathione S-transferase N-terminal domain-containing protein [Anaerococcus hydrog